MAEINLQELEALLPAEAQVGPYVLKKWTLKQFAQLLPAALGLVKKLQAQGLTWDNLERFIADRGLETLPLVLTESQEMLAVSLGISLAEVEALDWELGAAAIVQMFRVNLDALKNLPSLAPGAGGAGNSTDSP
jgi:hypothetical protein